MLCHFLFATKLIKKMCNFRLFAFFTDNFITFANSYITQY